MSSSSSTSHKPSLSKSALFPPHSPAQSSVDAASPDEGTQSQEILSFEFIQLLSPNYSHG